jgi:hypothetical protein
MEIIINTPNLYINIQDGLMLIEYVFNELVQIIANIDI